ncbi:hypothetical protein ACWC91_18395 [Streptomyces sp. NPDC001204]|uniref:hypothetical protein n=2 Tax=unclassified Streptomyces TaxID=2593676 RepID=UPI001CD2CF9A|nr:hypothetical protein [Streptomyces sp. CoT10]
MSRTPARVLAASALCAAVLLTGAACTAGQSGRAVHASTPAATRRPGPAAAPAAALTPDQARSALLTQADLGSPWAPTQGAATWRDGVLKARADVSECGRLLDALYTEEPFGTPSGAHAVAAYDDGDDGAQLRHQVLALRAPDVDRTLAWLKTMPQTCAEFTATAPNSDFMDVRVADLALPNAGDARQGLRLTFTTESYEDSLTTLTLDLATVRVGDDAIVLTTGAPGTLPRDATAQAVQHAVDRLTTVHDKARTPA